MFCAWDNIFLLLGVKTCYYRCRVVLCRTVRSQWNPYAMQCICLKISQVCCETLRSKAPQCSLSFYAIQYIYTLETEALDRHRCFMPLYSSGDLARVHAILLKYLEVRSKWLRIQSCWCGLECGEICCIRPDQDAWSCTTSLCEGANMHETAQKAKSRREQYNTSMYVCLTLYVVGLDYVWACGLIGAKLH